MSNAPWPPVVSLDTPLAVHLCPHVGRGVVVITPDASQSDFDETMSVIDAIEWKLANEALGVTEAGNEVVEITGEPADLVTTEAWGGANDQLLKLAGLLADDDDVEAPGGLNSLGLSDFGLGHLDRESQENPHF